MEILTVEGFRTEILDLNFSVSNSGCIKHRAKINEVLQLLNPDLFVVDFEGYNPLKGREQAQRRLCLQEYFGHVGACEFNMDERRIYEVQNEVNVYEYALDLF